MDKLICKTTIWVGWVPADKIQSLYSVAWDCLTKQSKCKHIGVAFIVRGGLCAKVLPEGNAFWS